MLDQTQHPLQIKVAAEPSVEGLLLGRPVSEALEILPRLFNLCRSAQEVGVYMAFDLPPPAGWQDRLAHEIARDHVLKLGVLLPRALGMSPLALPSPDITDMIAGLLGGVAFPETPGEFDTWLAHRQGVGLVRLLAKVDGLFSGGDAVVHDLPLVTSETAMAVVATENSAAQRHADHPVMVHVEETRGRGPLWRLVGRVLDMQAALAGQLPAPSRCGDAISVPAARGLYTIQAAQKGGKVAAFRRVTPTDHMLATGGMMQQSLDRLPMEKHHLAPILVDILDPCVAVSIQGGLPHA
jgi:hypothetical protein